MKLTDEELKAIREAVEAATSGPWEVMNNRDVFTHKGATSRTGIKADDNDGWHIADTMCGPTSVSGEDWELSYVERYANAHLIANAPTWLIAQLDHIEALTAKYNEELNRLSEENDGLLKSNAYLTARLKGEVEEKHNAKR